MTKAPLCTSKDVPELAGFLYRCLPGQAADHEANAWHAKMCVNSTAGNSDRMHSALTVSLCRYS